MRKFFFLAILIILIGSTLLAESVSGQSNPKPAVPEFTVTLADHSYDVPVTYTTSTNPYTGQQETHTQGGYHVKNKTIDVTITNQPFTSITIDGNTTQLYYVIRWKGHYENWNDNVTYSGCDYDYYLRIGGLKASDSMYTVKSYPLSLWNTKSGKIDFQVKAQAGYPFTYFGGHIQPIGTNFHAAAESGWSNTQTITIGENTSTTETPTTPAPQSTPTQTATVTPTQNPPTTSNQPVTQSGAVFGLYWKEIAIVVLAVLVAVSWVAIVVLWRKRGRN